MQFLFLNNAAKKESKIYSLVRLVPLLSKLIENLIKDRMAEQLDKYNLIDSSQHGSSKGRKGRGERNLPPFSQYRYFFCKHTQNGGAGEGKGVNEDGLN